MANENETTTSKEGSGMKKEKQEITSEDLTRRAFMAGTGAAAAGLVVGGVVGYGVSPETELTSPAVAPWPTNWIGRNLEACTGCKLCEIACSIEKEGKIWPAASRMRVLQYPPCVEFPVACYLCGADALCISACGENALTLDPATSIILIDTGKCLRTRTDSKNMDCVVCAEACPGDAVFFHPVTQEPLICDLCGGDPVCLAECPQKAIHVKGTSMSASRADEIGRALGHMYDLPASRRTPASRMPPPPRRRPTEVEG